MSDAPNRQASIDSRRIALEREISIRVPAFDDFVTEYSANISTTGMFIVSQKPQPPGTRFTFEFSVADDWKLIRGKGQVVWSRYRDEGKDRPAGMGIRFTQLDAQSRRLIRWIVEKHIREGGKPFELDDLRSAVDDALSEALDPEAPALAPPLKRRTAKRPSPPDIRPLRSERRWTPLLISALAVIALLAALFWLSERTGRMVGAAAPSQRDEAAQVTEARPRPELPETGTEAGEIAAAAESPGETAPAPRPSSAETGRRQTEPGPGEPVAAAAPSETSPSLEQVDAVVDAWSSAWTDQDVEAYLSHYSRNFKPAGGLSRSDWEAQRRERVSAPRFIRVAIAGLESERVGERRARATFDQSYRSDRFGDEVRKVLVLVWEEGAWKILEEKTLG